MGRVAGVEQLLYLFLGHQGRRRRSLDDRSAYRSGFVHPSRRTWGIFWLSGHMTHALSGPKLHQSARTTRARALGVFQDAKTTSTAKMAFKGLLCTRCDLYMNHT